MSIVHQFDASDSVVIDDVPRLMNVCIIIIIIFIFKIPTDLEKKLIDKW